MANLIDKNRIITKSDFETVKARFLMGDYLMASIGGSTGYILLTFCSGYATPYNKMTVYLIKILEFPESTRKIKKDSSKIYPYYVYKELGITNSLFSINLDQFVYLWDTLMK